MTTYINSGDARCRKWGCPAADDDDLSFILIKFQVVVGHPALNYCNTCLNVADC